MIPELRKQFNANFSADKYRRLLRLLEEGCGTPIAFRNCETPCFLPKALLDEMNCAGRELIERLLGDPTYLAAAGETIPPAYRVPNEDARPLFFQADFGLDEHRRPRLVEIQGFPSLYAYEPLLAERYREAYGLDAGLRCFLGGLDAAGYDALLRQAIVGDHDPENVILLEVRPQTQKTLPDFLLTERNWGVKAVCVSRVKQQGRRLFYPAGDGRLVPIERIYYRIVVDELVRSGVPSGFDFRDDLDVEWAGHPNWFFKVSKFSLPYLNGHPAVPRTQFLDRIKTLPDDLQNYVLKPLFSFAGLGVRVSPARQEIEAIAPADRSRYVLQERVNFRPVIETPFGPTKVEVRILYVWLDELRPVISLLRMGRDQMMGVDHNRNQEWIGASAAFFMD